MRRAPDQTARTPTGGAETPPPWPSLPVTRALDSYQLDTPLTAVAGSAVAASDLPQAAFPSRQR